MTNRSSTRFRLTLWYVGVLFLILTLLAILAYYLFTRSIYSQTDTALSEVGTTFEMTAKRHLELSEDPEKSIHEAIRDTAVEVSFKNYKIYIFSADKTLLWETRTTQLETSIEGDTAKTLLGSFSQESEANTDFHSREGRSFRVHFHPYDIRGKRFYLVVIHPLDGQQALLQKVRFAFFITVPLALIMASLGGSLLASKSLAPISEMSKKAGEISASNLFERLPVENDRDELGRLAKSFNRLLSRLNLSFEQQRRFMADASHELRSPVAIVRGEADVCLNRSGRTETEYRETIEIIRKEAERMSRVIEELFTMARVDAGENPLIETEVFLEDILAETVKAFRSLKLKHEISLILEVKQEMPIVADEYFLRRLFANLIDNALKNTRSFVKITAAERNGSYTINVIDDGAGIPIEHQPHIFERFYRVDKARSRRNRSPVGSGAGLGLSISRWIAEMHNGSLELARSDPEGSVFTIDLPAP